MTVLRSVYVQNSYLRDVADGLIEGSKIWKAMGERENMSPSSAGEDVWRGNDLTPSAPDFIPLPTITGEQMEVVSTSSQDMPSGILSFTGNALDTETVTVGTKTYTFQTTLTDVDGNILIGATTAETIDNLVKALYPEPNGGKGTVYAQSMTMQPEGILAADTGANSVVFSTATGGLASTETLTNASFTSGTFSAKTGTALVEIEYLDAEGEEQEENVIMNGTTAVSTSFTDGIFVNDFYCKLVSEHGTTTGNITVRQVGGGSSSTYNMLAIGQNKSLVPKRMIPKGKTLTILGWDCSEVQGRRVIYRIRATASHGKRVRHIYHFIDNEYLRNGASPQLIVCEKIPELSLITISAWGDSPSAEGSASWWGVLSDNE